MKLCTEDFYKIPEKKRNGIYEVENLGTFYWVNGKCHREDGPASEYVKGTKYWFINGKLHRLDGPAIEFINGDKYWYINDKYHRLDGPAVEWNNGDIQYWIEGKVYSTKEEFEKVAYMYKNGLQDYL